MEAPARPPNGVIAPAQTAQRREFVAAEDARTSPFGPGSSDPVRYLAATGLVVLGVLALGLTLNLLLFSRLQHRAAQTRAFDRLRNELAQGVAPLGQTDQAGRLLAAGTPVAVLGIPVLGLSEAVLEGTTSAVLMSGPGHLRDTVLPGQAGTSVIFGRAAAYGGPFGGLHRLDVGSTIKVTTGIGSSTFKVVDLRRDGGPNPPALASGAARLTLVTASGFPFVPSGVLRVDADLVGTAQPAPTLAITSVPRDELAMTTQGGIPWGLIFLLQVLILLAAGSVWSSHRWGGPRTWIVFFPVVALVAFTLTTQVSRLLPNLL